MGYGCDCEDYGGQLADMDFYGECPNCGEVVENDAKKCPECGMHFD